MIERIDIELLEKYLVGEIEAGELIYLDGSSISPQELKGIIAEYEDLQLHIEAASFKKHLQSFNYQEEETSSWGKVLLVAASIVLLSVFGYLFLRNQESSFDNYFAHFDQLVTFRGSEKAAYSDGLEAYSNKNYPLAYERLLKAEPLNEELRFYLAVSALGAEKYEEAISNFLIIGSDGENKYSEQIRWYLALAYWQNEELKKSLNLLKSIKKGQFNYNLARDLIYQLEVQ